MIRNDRIDRHLDPTRAAPDLMFLSSLLGRTDAADPTLMVLAGPPPPSNLQEPQRASASPSAEALLA
jgi:hypothetical protein